MLEVVRMTSSWIFPALAISSLASAGFFFVQWRRALRKPIDSLRERRLQAIIARAPGIIYLKDATTGRFLLGNEAFFRALCLEPEQVIGKRAEELLPAEIASSLSSHEEQVIHQERSMTFEEQFPVGGELRSFLSTKYLLTNGSGWKKAVGSISIDLLPQRQTADLLRQQIDELRYRNRTLTDNVKRERLGTCRQSCSQLDTAIRKLREAASL